MKGWIYGEKGQKQWTQKIFKQSHQFQNPLHQNLKHVRTLQELLGLEPHKIHSVVVFIGNSTFKTAMPKNVMRSRDYIRYIKSMNLKLLTPTEVRIIFKKIESKRFANNLKTHFDHVGNVKQLVKEKSATNNCPICGNSMVMREAKQGLNKGNKFWGCSRFPKCKGLVNIT